MQLSCLRSGLKMSSQAPDNHPSSPCLPTPRPSDISLRRSQRIRTISYTSHSARTGVNRRSQLRRDARSPRVLNPLQREQLEARIEEIPVFAPRAAHDNQALSGRGARENVGGPGATFPSHQAWVPLERITFQPSSDDPTAQLYPFNLPISSLYAPVHRTSSQDMR